MPQQASVSRLERILVLVPWVIANPGTTVSEVCARFSITREELLADLDLLFVCGLPPFTPADLIEAYVDGERVVIKMAPFFERPLRLSRLEALSLLLAGKAVAALPGLAEAESLRSALGKLERAIAPSAGRGIVDRVDIRWDEAPAQHLAQLREAISERRRMRMTYYSFGRDAVGERAVDPLLVFAATGNWYVVAFDHQSGEDRVFRLDRIKELQPTEQRFEPRADFDPGRYARRALFTPSASDLEVEVELAPDAAWVRELTPHDSSEEIDDGWTRLRLRTPHLAWVVRLLMRLGPRARVVSPAELVDALRETAARALARYA